MHTWCGWACHGIWLCGSAVASHTRAALLEWSPGLECCFPLHRWAPFAAALVARPWALVVMQWRHQGARHRRALPAAL